MGPGDAEDNFSFPLIEMLDQIFEETLEEVTNQNTTVASESDNLQEMESQVKVNVQRKQKVFLSSVTGFTITTVLREWSNGFEIHSIKVEGLGIVPCLCLYQTCHLKVHLN